jgi:hypothetical protein
VQSAFWRVIIPNNKRSTAASIVEVLHVNQDFKVYVVVLEVFMKAQEGARGSV